MVALIAVLNWAKRIEISELQTFRELETEEISTLREISKRQDHQLTNLPANGRWPATVAQLMQTRRQVCLYPTLSAPD